eukprot:3181105-Rhodomonas_salina.1
MDGFVLKRQCLNLPRDAAPTMQKLNSLLAGVACAEQSANDAYVQAWWQHYRQQVSSGAIVPDEDAPPGFWLYDQGQ